MISVTDIKHYIYCPRIVYFEKVLHAKPQFGSQQEESLRLHEEIEEKELRRKGVIPYIKELKELEKQFRIQLVSQRLKLQGTVDCIVKLGEEFIPIDYKNMESNNGKPWIDHKYQLAAYSLLIEENYGVTVRKGYLSYLPEKLSLKIEITPAMKTHVKRLITRIREIVCTEKPPKVFPSPKKCGGGCGYKWICQPTKFS